MERPLDKENKTIYNNSEKVERLGKLVEKYIREKIFGKITVSFQAGKITCLKTEITEVQ